MLQNTSLRMTKQRQVIMEELCSVITHPTAEEIYEMVRTRLPNVSLGTVYRNLETLSEAGVIQKLDVGGTKKRFDGNVTTHSHLRCKQCGRVDDVDFKPGIDLESAVKPFTGYQIIKHRLEFIGLCPDCQ